MRFVILMIATLIATNVYAEKIPFIINGEYQIENRTNDNFDQMPKAIQALAKRDDAGIQCVNIYTGKRFYVLVHHAKMHDYNNGYQYGSVNVKMFTSYLATIKGQQIHEFIKWGN